MQSGSAYRCTEQSVSTYCRGKRQGQRPSPLRSALGPVQRKTLPTPPLPLAPEATPLNAEEDTINTLPGEKVTVSTQQTAEVRTDCNGEPAGTENVKGNFLPDGRTLNVKRAGVRIARARERLVRLVTSRSLLSRPMYTACAVGDRGYIREYDSGPF